MSEGLKVVRLGLELDPKHEGLIKLATEIKYELNNNMEHANETVKALEGEMNIETLKDVLEKKNKIDSNVKEMKKLLEVALNESKAINDTYNKLLQG